MNTTTSCNVYTDHAVCELDRPRDQARPRHSRSEREESAMTRRATVEKFTPLQTSTVCRVLLCVIMSLGRVAGGGVWHVGFYKTLLHQQYAGCSLRVILSLGRVAGGGVWHVGFIKLCYTNHG